MKITIITAIVVGVAGLAFFNYEVPSEYVKEQIEEATLEVVEEVKEVDIIEKARLELEKINTDLDTKEKELLEERKKIDTELERLRQTRVSFQSAPEQKGSPKP